MSVQERERSARLRGWIVYLLYKERPQPLEFGVLMRLLDRFNYPLTRRQLGAEVDYLRAYRPRPDVPGLVQVFPLGSKDPMKNTEQAQLVQRYCGTESDEDMGMVLCVRLTALGIDYHQGLFDVDGIERRD